MSLVLPRPRSFVPRIAASRRAAAFAVAAALGLGGCAGMKQIVFAPHVGDCEGFDVSLSVFTGASRKELRARVMAPGVDHDFPFVVEKTGESLVLVGFTPLGTKSFTLERKGDEVDVESFVGPVPTVSPRNVMEDVLAMSLPSSCSTSPEAVATASYDGWKVDDTCHNSRPNLRHFHRTDAKDGAPPDIEIEYREDAIVVRQKKCNYVARYVLQAVAQPAPATAAATPTPAKTAPAKSPPPAAGAAPAKTPSNAAPAKTTAAPVSGAAPAATTPGAAPPATSATTTPAKTKAATKNGSAKKGSATPAKNGTGSKMDAPATKPSAPDTAPAAATPPPAPSPATTGTAGGTNDPKN